MPSLDPFSTRYGIETESPSETAITIIEAMLNHRSVRAYLPNNVDDEALRVLIAAAQSASSSSNVQAWSVVAVRYAERKRRLSVLAGDQAWISEAPLFLVWLGDLSRIFSVASALGEEVEAPHSLEMMLVATIDAALAAQNAAIAAEAMGLGIVYIGGIRNQPEAVAAELGLPPHVMPLFGMCVGHPDTQRTTAVKPRLPQRLVLHEEQYAPLNDISALDGYDDRLQAFQRKQGLRATGWIKPLIDRQRSVANLNGRHRLAEALRALGFEMR
nr:nitroreductase family protein [Sphingomonas sp. Y57]